MHFNNGFLDCLVDVDDMLDTINSKGYSITELFEDDSYKNNWIYEITINNVYPCSMELDEYRTDYWTEFDIVEIKPIMELQGSPMTNAEAAFIDLSNRKERVKKIRDIVSAQTKDGKKWDLCKLWGGLAIQSVSGETFRMSKDEYKFKSDSIDWHNLEVIEKGVREFFGITGKTIADIETDEYCEENDYNEEPEPDVF